MLLFATTALLCSGVTETLSNILQVRAKYLLTGLRAMLDDPGAKASLLGTGVHDDVKDREKAADAAEKVRATIALARDPGAVPGAGWKVPNLTTALFDSPLLQSLQSYRVGVFRSRLRNPQYVSGRAFARALVDLLVPATVDGTPQAAVDIDTVAAAVRGLPEEWPVRRQLLAYLSRAGDLDAFERCLEQWYDEQMAKISGWYKRWARVVLGIVGFAVAAAANVDTLAVAHALYVDAPVQQAVVATADAGTLCQAATDVAQRNACTTQALEALRVSGVPLGWPATGAQGFWGVVLKGLGWVITAFAVSFGAPFWFEALSKLGSLRTAGTRPPPAGP